MFAGDERARCTTAAVRRGAGRRRAVPRRQPREAGPRGRSAVRQGSRRNARRHRDEERPDRRGTLWRGLSREHPLRELVDGKVDHRRDDRHAGVGRTSSSRRDRAGPGLAAPRRSARRDHAAPTPPDAVRPAPFRGDRAGLRIGRSANAVPRRTRRHGALRRRPAARGRAGTPVRILDGDERHSRGPRGQGAFTRERSRKPPPCRGRILAHAPVRTGPHEVDAARIRCGGHARRRFAHPRHRARLGEVRRVPAQQGFGTRRADHPTPMDRVHGHALGARTSVRCADLAEPLADERRSRPVPRTRPEGPVRLHRPSRPVRAGQPEPGAL